MTYTSPERIQAIKNEMSHEASYWNNRPRFGLFSHPPNKSPEVTGNIQSPKRSSTLNRAAKSEKVFLSGKYKAGQLMSDLFSVPAYQNSAYQESFRTTKLRNYSLDKSLHEKMFIPNGGPLKPIGTGFYYIPDPIRVVERGKVRHEQKNFMTSPPKKGYANTSVGHLFEKRFEYHSDPYDRQKELDLKEKQEHIAKIISNAPFRVASITNGAFSKDSDIYKRDQVPEHAKQSRSNSSPSLHKEVFKYTSNPKTGYNMTINKFPEYISSPMISPKADMMKRSWKDEPIWRDTHHEKTKPCPSIMGTFSKVRPRGIF